MHYAVAQQPFGKLTHQLLMAEGQRRTNRKKNTDKSTQTLHLNHFLNSWNSIELSHLAHMPSTCGSVGEVGRGRVALNNSGMQQSLKMGYSWGWIKRNIHGGVGRCRNLRSFTSCAIKGIIHPPTTEDHRQLQKLLPRSPHGESLPPNIRLDAQPMNYGIGNSEGIAVKTSGSTTDQALHTHIPSPRWLYLSLWAGVPFRLLCWSFLGA